jgi:flavorubredoxin
MAGNKQNPESGTGMKALIVYWTATGNTEKVANAIQKTLLDEKVTSKLVKIPEAEGEELNEYDLIFLGSPSYEWHPPDPVKAFIKQKIVYHRERGDVKMGAPRLPGKTAVIFCTYSGPHTGVNEAIPVCKYLGQFFEHIGFEVAGEWCIVGEFHDRLEFNTEGRLGDIRGRPNEQDLSKVENDVRELIKSIRAVS